VSRTAVVPLTAAHADAAARIVVASITELCGADHGHDPGAIARWTANKTPAAVAGWCAAPDAIARLALWADRPAAVGLATRAGEVRLLYVDPGHRFRGLSDALLADLEAAMRADGAVRGRLVSTRTAQAFYTARGWSPDPAATGPHADMTLTKALAGGAVG